MMLYMYIVFISKQNNGEKNMKYFLYANVLTNALDQDTVLFASDDFKKVSDKRNELCKKLDLKECHITLDVTTKKIRTGSKLNKIF